MNDLCTYINQIADGRFDVSPFEYASEEDRAKLMVLGQRLRGVSCEALSQYVIDEIIDHWRESSYAITIDDIDMNVIDDTKQYGFVVVVTVYLRAQQSDRDQEDFVPDRLFLTIKSSTEIQGRWVRAGE